MADLTLEQLRAAEAGCKGCVHSVPVQFVGAKTPLNVCEFGGKYGTRCDDFKAKALVH